MGAPIYPTNRAIALAACGVPISLTLGVMRETLWVSGFAWLALVALLILADAILSITGSIPTMRIQTPPPLQIGRQEKLIVRADFAGVPPTVVEFVLGVSEKIGVAPAVLKGGAGEECAFTLSPHRRGDASIDQVWARWHGPLGLIWRQRAEGIHKSAPVLMNTSAARDMATRLFSRSAHPGDTLHIEPGEGSELNALKEFTAGSDRRMIDWKQSARHGTLLTREYRSERSTRIVLAVDAGRIMAEPVNGSPRIDRALTAALNLAYVALKGGDRISLFSFDSAPRIASALVSGTHAFNDLQKLAGKIEYSTEETDFSGGISGMLGQLERRSIIVFFTDFSDQLAASRMVENIGRLIGAHAVLFVAFRDDDVEAEADAEPATTRDVARAVVAGAMMEERRAVFAHLKQIGVHVLEVQPQDATPPLLTHYLRLKQEFAR
jgi:uncharacterized protein (DUF58 family)